MLVSSESAPWRWSTVPGTVGGNQIEIIKEEQEEEPPPETDIQPWVKTSMLFFSKLCSRGPELIFQPYNWNVRNFKRMANFAVNGYQSHYTKHEKDGCLTNIPVKKPFLNRGWGPVAQWLRALPADEEFSGVNPTATALSGVHRHEMQM